MRTRRRPHWYLPTRDSSAIAAVLAKATSRYRASDLVVEGDSSFTIPNAKGGTAITVPNDTNQPTYLAHEGVNRVWTPEQLFTNYVTLGSIPMSGSAAEYALVSRREDTINAAAIGYVTQTIGGLTFRFYMTFLPGGTVRIGSTQDGGTTGQDLDLSVPGCETARWVEIRIEPGTTNGRARISNTDTYDRNEVVWEAWVTGNFGANIKQASGTVTMPLYNTSGGFAALWLVEDGTDIASIDAEDAGTDEHNGWTDSVSGQSTSIVRTTVGLKTAIVTEPVLIFDGIDDYLQHPASDNPTFTGSAGKYSVFLAMRKTGAGSTESIWSSASNYYQGLTLYLSAGVTYVATVRDTTTVVQDSVTPISDGDLWLIGAVVDDGLLSGAAFSDAVAVLGTPTVSITGVPSPTFDTAPRTGSQSFVVDTEDFELTEVIIFDGVALTLEECQTLADELRGV